MRRRIKEVTPGDVHKIHVTLKSIETLLRQQNALLRGLKKGDS